MNIEIVFFGSSEFSAVVLQDLVDHYEANHIHIAAVVTKKDSPVGRKQVITPTIVKQYALSQHIPVMHSLDKAKEYILQNNIDMAITASYGRILKKDLLDAPKHGFINVHPSAIPDLRGAIPIQMALFRGDKTSAVSIITVEEGMDTGDILIQEPFHIGPEDTFGSLSIRMAHVGAQLLKKVVSAFVTGQLVLQKQDDAKATYCYVKDIETIKQVSYEHDDAYTIERAVRALAPFTQITFSIGDLRIGLCDVCAIDSSQIQENLMKKGMVGIYQHEGKKDLYLVCEDNVLLLKKIKPQGKNEMTGNDFYNGYKGKLPISSQ